MSAAHAQHVGPEEPETRMARNSLMLVLVATLLLGTVAGCRTSARPSTSGTASALQSLTLAEYSGSGNPGVGGSLLPSKCQVFLSGHIDSARRLAPEDSASSEPNRVELSFDAPGTNALLKWTTSHVGRWMVVLLNGQVVSVKLVDRQIRDGCLSIPVDPDSAAGGQLLEVVAGP
jgi:hypothetical protein